jgi:hypothetical protein
MHLEAPCAITDTRFSEAHIDALAPAQRTEPDRTPSSTHEFIPTAFTLEQTGHYSAAASSARSLPKNTYS